MSGHEHHDWVQRARAVRIEQEIARRSLKLRRVGPELVGACPKCGGDDRFAISLKKQLFNCRGCGAKGDVIDFVRFHDVVDFNTACTQLAGEPPAKTNGKGGGKDTVERSKKVIVASFEYLDENGNVLFVKDRVEFQKAAGSFVLKDGKHDKIFSQRRPSPDHPDRWIPDVKGVRVVPYRLPDLAEALANNRTVFIVEGEAKANFLWDWNLAATCCAGGAKKWKPEHSEFLRNADVVLVPDHDNAGWEHINKVGADLVGIAKRTRVLLLPHVRAKDDVIDWARNGGTRERLDALLTEAKDWQPPPEDAAADAGRSKKKKKSKDWSKAHEDELLEALARAQGLDYARRRKQAADDLGVTQGEIDQEIRARREKVPLYGHWIVEPWPERIDGDSLLRDIIRKCRRYVICSHDDALAGALWAVLAWVHDVATHSPILCITSAEPMSGKTTMLGVLSFLVPRSIRSVEITEAALYRSIELWHPTFVIDEFDSVLSNDDKAALRSVINSGYTRGDGVLRINKDKNNEPEIFPTFGPKAIGMVGRMLPPATLTRCIFVELYRRKREETVEKFRFVDDNELSDLRRRLRRYQLDNEDKLGNANPLIPVELENRYDDNWRLQFAIADLAGEDWGDQARAAAIKIERASDNTTKSARVLASIQKVLEIEDGQDAIGSQALIDKLAAVPDSEWAEYRHGKPISQRQLAALLKPHRIFPEQVWINGQQVRGYRKLRFKDAWERYL